MNKTVVVIGALGAGAFMLFMWKKKSSSNKTPLGIPAASNSPGSMPRVDNQQQPWYTGALGWAKTKEQNYAQNPALVQSDLQSVVHSASDVWGTVSGFFGSSPGIADHVDSAVPGTNSPSSDPTSIAQDPSTLTLPASDVQQSNILGAQIGNFSDGLDMNIASQGASNDSSVDASNSDSIGSDNMMSA